MLQLLQALKVPQRDALQIQNEQLPVTQSPPFRCLDEPRLTAQIQLVIARKVGCEFLLIVKHVFSRAWVWLSSQRTKLPPLQ